MTGRETMEVVEGSHLRERGRTEREPEVAAVGGDTARGPPLSGTSYWLDFWLLILFDLVLFAFVYLLP